MSETDPVNNRIQHLPFWEKPYEDFKERLTAKALMLANGRVHDAEDLVQETVCRALTYSRNHEEIRNPLGYLLRIMYHIWITKWRAENTANMESLDELLSKEADQKPHRSVEPAVAPDAERLFENNELRAEMRAKQGPLTTREKLLLALHLEGYTCKEIADQLGEDVRLVRLDLNAVRTKVRSRLMNCRH